MKARPILMSAPMVRALLAGLKTQTRRTVKPQPDWSDGKLAAQFTPDDQRLGRLGKIIECPYGASGDLLWVRETFCDDWQDRQAIEYRADGGLDADMIDAGCKWRPSIFMPRAASRLTLRITDVRVQRLQDISEVDARAEGAPPSHPSIDAVSREFGYADFPRSWYAQLWDSINGPGRWEANPWVWCVSFSVVNANVDSLLREAA